MAINTTLQTIKLDYEQICDSKQIVVQCNLDTTSKGGISKICQAQSEVVIESTQILAKQIKVQGKAYIKVVFLNSEGAPSAFDYIADFVETIAQDSVSEEMSASVRARVVDTENSVSGNQIKIQCVIDLTPVVLEGITQDFVVDVEGALAEKNTCVTQEFVRCISDSMQVGESVQTGMQVEEVLLFACKAIVCEVETLKGDLVVSGRCNAEIIYTSGGRVYNQTMCIPFVKEVGDGGVYTRAAICATVTGSKLMIEGTDLENNLRAEITIELSGNVFEVGEVQLIKDVFCPTQKLEASSKELKFVEVVGIKLIEEKISGSVECDDKNVIIRKILSCGVVSCSTENIYASSGVMVVEGLALVGIVYETDEEKISCMQIELPYSLQSKCDDDINGKSFAGSCIVCDSVARIKRGREVEIDATIIIAVNISKEQTVSGLVCIEEGEEIQTKKAAISIVVAEVGETMWSLAKKLAMPIATIKEQNEVTGDVMQGGERFVVYREIK